MDLCGQVCAGVGIDFDSDVKQADFIQSAASSYVRPYSKKRGASIWQFSIRRIVRSIVILMFDMYCGLQE